MSPVLRWASAGATTEELVRAHVLAALGPGTVDVGHLCPLCGSSVHGRPWARHAPPVPDLPTRPATGSVLAGASSAVREVFVSVSRAAGYAVTALSLRGPVGVDVEVVADVDRGWDPALVLAPGERAGTPAERAWCWAAKEAGLKRRGTGLTTPMTQVRLADEGELHRIPAPDGLVAVLAPPRCGTGTGTFA